MTFLNSDNMNTSRVYISQTTERYSNVSYNISNKDEMGNVFTFANTDDIVLNLPMTVSRDIYMNYYNVFCNGCDFGPLWSMMESLCSNNLSLSIFIVGANLWPDRTNGSKFTAHPLYIYICTNCVLCICVLVK